MKKPTSSLKKKKGAKKRTKSPKRVLAVAPFPVVGVGASAGGLEAFFQLLALLPEKPGFAIMFVQHLAPTHESALLELLLKKSAVPVVEMRHNMRLQSNHVYIITPGVTVEIKKGSCVVLQHRESKGVFHPVDILFRSLAQEYGSDAIGVVLSGTATDGTDGLLAIKESGGITFAQDESAKHPGMPRSAIESDAVNFILPPQRIAKELLRLAKHPFIAPPAKKESSANDEGARKILSLLSTRFGVDFSGYKQTMVRRRIERRIIFARQKTLGDYSQYLKDTEGEDQALYQDLLINVTSFFRDAEMFASLSRHVLPALLRSRQSSDALRIWVPGCSTGEEVFSIAITLIEVLERMYPKSPPQFSIKIFGTDVNKQSIEKARFGIYSKSTLQQISRERLARFFQPVNGSYQVHKSLREMCVFSPHNFLKDPPFSRMDLISCQNVLIYFDASLQKKAIRAFHYALKPEGYLILGKSETVGAEGTLFETSDKKLKVYTRKLGSVAGRLFPEAQPHVLTRIKKYKDERETKTASIEVEADELLLRDFTPASMVINADMEIIRFRGATSPYLEPSAGNASLSLMKMVRQELALELRVLVHTAKKDDHLVKKEGIPMMRNGTVHPTTIEVVPLKGDTSSAYFLVLFRDSARPFAPEEVPAGGRKSGSKEKHTARFMREFSLQKEQMKSMSEEYEAANEELQSANEEVLSSNEELQTLNEELETSQEELQSTNEELTTINDELGVRNNEIAEARDFAEAIIATIRGPLIVLDRNLKVQTANKSFYAQFKSTPEETEGHVLHTLGNHQWDVPDLRRMLSEILPQQKQVYDFEIDHEFPQIGRRVVLLNARTLARRAGGEELILLAIEDVTDKHDFEKRRDEFISMASHELRTPVTSIKGYAQLLESTFTKKGDEGSALLASKLDRQVDNLNRLISDLFDDTKVKEGKLELHLDYFDLNALVGESIDEIQHATVQHKITCTLGSIPKVYGDRERIKQVIVNLISNATKYSPRATSIKVSTKNNGDNVMLYVQDFGVGVSKKDQAKIFTRFYRVQGKNLDTYPGLGLGLYIAAEIVERHGGRMEVKSSKGKGSIFSVTLPVKKQDKTV